MVRLMLVARIVFYVGNEMRLVGGHTDTFTLTIRVPCTGLLHNMYEV
jgi:hypothetical protein